MRMFECSRPELRVLANSDSEMQSFESCRLRQPVRLQRVLKRTALEMPRYRGISPSSLVSVSGVLVSAGMTCTVVMKEGAAPQIGRSIKKVMTDLNDNSEVWLSAPASAPFTGPYHLERGLRRYRLTQW